jgi:CheY-like chemotaxis protein
MAGLRSQFENLLIDPQPQLLVNTSPTPPEQKSKLKLVVIDDEAPMLDIISTTLRARDYEVTTFTEPLKALKWLTSIGWNIDLVITDIIMPGKDGLALARTLRSKAGPIAILLISARISDEGLWGEDQQDLPFLAKPFTTAELVEAVETTIARFPRQQPDS